MRGLVHQTVVDVMAGTDVGDRVFATGSLGVGDVPAAPQKPYCTVREGESTFFQAVSETGKAERIPYQVSIYSERGSTVDARAMLLLLMDAIKALPGTDHASGRCIGSEWGSISQDFVDEPRDASVKFALFTVSGSQH